MSSLIVDTRAIIQVIGAIYVDNSLLDNEEYFFTESDFTEDFHRIIFGSIYNLHQLGVTNINVATIEDYLSQRPTKMSTYKAHKGDVYLENLKDIVQLSSFNYYYNRMKKMTLLRSLKEDLKIDISWIYDVDNILDIKKKQRQEDFLDKTSIDELFNLVNDKIETLKATFSKSSEIETSDAGKGIFDLLNKYDEHPDVGLPLFGKFMNTIHRGARLGKVFLRSSATNVGKALPNDMIIPTPNGYKKIGEIKVGDYLFGKNGTPTKVLRTFPQQEAKDVYKITFIDGREVECCKDHLWEYYVKEGRENKKYIQTTEEILKRANNSKGGFRRTLNKGYKFKIPMNKPVQYPKKDLPIDPYVLGVLIGDGSFRYNNNNKALTLSSENEEIPKMIADICGYNYKKNSDKNYNWTFEHKNQEIIGHKNVWVEDILKDYSYLWNVKTEDKVIPEEYLLGDIEQRFSLLQGLLDTDGSIQKTCQISFCTINETLKNQVTELCYSLGFKVAIKEEKRVEKYTTGTLYYLNIQSSNEDKIKMFRLERKKNIAIKNFQEKGEGRTPDKSLFLPITNIEKTDKKKEMTCFTVDAEDSLFLAEHFIVTHNTRTLIADFCSLGAKEVFNREKNKWEEKPSCSSLFIATEQELEEIQLMMLAFISDVPEDYIADNNYPSPILRERVVKAAEVIQNSPLYVTILPDFTLADIEKTITINIRNNNVMYVFLDYVHSSVGILSEISSKAKVSGLREDNVLFMMMTKLKAICQKYKIFLMTATQLNGSYQDAKVYDQNLLRGAKSVADKIDWGSIMIEVDQKDKEGLQEIIQLAGFDMPDIKMAIYKNRRTKWKNILVWCKRRTETCRIEPMFVTDYNYKIIEIEDLIINVSKEDFIQEKKEEPSSPTKEEINKIEEGEAIINEKISEENERNTKAVDFEEGFIFH